MADCDPPPTATLLQTVTQTQDQVVTSFSVVSDLSGTISLETLTSCAGLSTGTGGGCAKPTTVVHTATVDQIATRQVPFTQTFHNTVTITQPTKTLFGQCRQTHSTLSTPSPTIIDVPTTTTNDQGDTYVATVKTTSTPPPTLVADSTITTGPTDTAAANGVGSGGGGGSGGGSNIAAIAGGVVGGVVLLGLIGGLVWLWWRRRKRWDDIFDDNDEVLKNGRPGAMTQLKSDGGQADFGNPTPYQYGIVGSQAPERHVTHASYSGISPGHSPQPSQGSNLGPADPRYTMALPPLHQPQVYPPVSPPPTIGSQHSRNNSTRPPSSYSSRPSSPAHSRRRSRGPDEVIGLVALGPREMSPPQTPTALPNITPLVPTPMTTSTTGATTTQVIGGRVVMSATPQIQTTTAIVHTDGGRVEPISPQVSSSSSTAGATTTQLITRPNEKRPRVVMSAAPVVVHTDGGRVDPASPPAGAGPSIPERENSTGDDAPPAYS